MKNVILSVSVFLVLDIWCSRSASLARVVLLGPLVCLVPHVAGPGPRGRHPGGDHLRGRGRRRGLPRGPGPPGLGPPQQLLVVLGLLGEVVVLHAVRNRLPLQILRDGSKVLGVLKKFLAKGFLLLIIPHVDVLPVVVDDHGVGNESVSVGELPLDQIRGQQ